MEYVERTMGYSQDWHRLYVHGKYLTNLDEAIALSKEINLKVQLRQGDKTWDNLDDPNAITPGYVFTQEELDDLERQKKEIKEHLTKLYPPKNK